MVAATRAATAAASSGERLFRPPLESSGPLLLEPSEEPLESDSGRLKKSLRNCGASSVGNSTPATRDDILLDTAPNLSDAVSRNSAADSWALVIHPVDVFRNSNSKRDCECEYSQSTAKRSPKLQTYLRTDNWHTRERPRRQLPQQWVHERPWQRISEGQYKRARECAPDAMSYLEHLAIDEFVHVKRPKTKMREMSQKPGAVSDQRLRYVFDGV